MLTSLNSFLGLYIRNGHQMNLFWWRDSKDSNHWIRITPPLDLNPLARFEASRTHRWAGLNLTIMTSWQLAPTTRSPLNMYLSSRVDCFKPCRAAVSLKEGGFSVLSVWVTVNGLIQEARAMPPLRLWLELVWGRFYLIAEQINKQQRRWRRRGAFCCE